MADLLETIIEVLAHSSGLKKPVNRKGCLLMVLISVILTILVIVFA